MNKEYTFIIYDTSNFIDFPIGGQLTSVRNFLYYMAERKRDTCDSILLVGVTTIEAQLGIRKKICIGTAEFDFLAVVYRDNNLSAVSKSLRMEFLKGLFVYRKELRSKVHYIHTPEAFIAIKCTRPRAKTAVFSHGSFFNMAEGFRFYKNNKVLVTLFHGFLICMLKTADVIFTLDKVSAQQYSQYTTKILPVENSIIPPKIQQTRENCHSPVRLLYVGRLSSVKRIVTIIQAVESSKELELTIVGDGEEGDNLRAMIADTKKKSGIKFVGAVQPGQVGEYMCNSDILVMNSTLEGKPMTIIEAMSYGMPVVTTAVGGIPELVQNGKNAEFTDGSAPSILKATQRIVLNYKEYAHLSLMNSVKYEYRTINGRIYDQLMKMHKQCK